MFSTLELLKNLENYSSFEQKLVVYKNTLNARYYLDRALEVLYIGRIGSKLQCPALRLML